VIQVRVLGTAQDGGVPQLGCRCRNCNRARRDPAFARRVVSLGIIDDRAELRYLVEATPDLPRQWEDLLDPGRRLRIDGLVLTHAHAGHYAGLLHLGKEGAEVWGLPLWMTNSMASFLRGNAPWSALLDAGMLAQRALEPDRPVRLSEDAALVPFLVPHRAEYTDTLGFEIRGPDGTLLCVTDADDWTSWADDLRDRCARAKVVLLDATFFSSDELPGRDIAEIPHPCVAENLELLREIAGYTDVYLTHLNHSNPLLDPESGERQIALEAGLTVLDEGAVFELGGRPTTA
jgi:pyrroloquinoline quinone biosynthesis protein B